MLVTLFRFGFASCLAAPLLLGAQPADSVRVNDRVRFHRLGDSHRFIGTVLDRRADTLIIQDRDGMTHRLPPGALVDAQVSTGRSAKRSAIKGAVAGVIGGLALGLYEQNSRRSGAITPGVSARVGTFVAVGAISGAIRPEEHWRTVRVPTAAPRAVVATAPAAASAMMLPPSRVTSGIVYDSIPAAETIEHTSRVLAIGDIIRITTNSLRSAEGRVEAASQDSLRFLRGAITQRLAFSDITKVERFYGRTARAGGVRLGTIGAGIGGVLGALTGMALAGMGSASRQPNYAGAALGFGALGAGIGFSMGMQQGAAFPADDWRTVRREDLRR